MTTKELDKVHRAQPFVPFRLHLAGGRSLEVGHPEWMAYVSGARTTVVYRPDGDFEILDLLLIESIEVLSGSKGRKGGGANGKQNGH